MWKIYNPIFRQLVIRKASLNLWLGKLKIQDMIVTVNLYQFAFFLRKSCEREYFSPRTSYEKSLVCIFKVIYMLATIGPREVLKFGRSRKKVVENEI